MTFASRSSESDPSATHEAEERVRRSVVAYARHARRYARVHCEIFNDVEQARLRQSLIVAAEAVRSGGTEALDYGCGTGNLTRHLQQLGFHVIAADVSPHFLQMVSEGHQVSTIHLLGGRLDQVPNSAFDLIGLYSVLHHIPDYLGVARQLVAKLKPGGVLFLDHEHSENYWRPDVALASFRTELASLPPTSFWDPERKRWQHLLRAAVSPRRSIHRVARWRNPRWSREGDIHVWPDDHIDFDALTDSLAAAGAVVVSHDSYLSYSAAYDFDIWAKYRDMTADMSSLIVRRLPR